MKIIINLFTIMICLEASAIEVKHETLLGGGQRIAFIQNLYDQIPQIVRENINRKIYNNKTYKILERNIEKISMFDWEEALNNSAKEWAFYFNEARKIAIDDPLFSLNSCLAPECLLAESKTSNLRERFLWETVNLFKNTHDKESPINYLSLGSGLLFFDLHILKALIESGYKIQSITLIDLKFTSFLDYLKQNPSEQITFDEQHIHPLYVFFAIHLSSQFFAYLQHMQTEPIELNIFDASSSYFKNMSYSGQISKADLFVSMDMVDNIETIWPKALIEFYWMISPHLASKAVMGIAYKKELEARLKLFVKEENEQILDGTNDIINQFINRFEPSKEGESQVESYRWLKENNFYALGLNRVNVDFE